MGTQRIEGQVINTSQQMGLASLPDNINVHVGATPTLITDPAESDPNNNSSRYLILNVEKGSFRIQVGDTTGTIGAFAVPSANVTDGSSTLGLEEFEIYVFTAPDKFTVVGSAADSVLTYSWVTGS